MNTINIKIENALTHKVEVDSTIMVDKCDIDVISANHEAFSQVFPDSHVNFSWNDGISFMFGMPHNQKLDEVKVDKGEMSYSDYFDKWYNQTAVRNNEEEYTEDDHLMDFCENYAE